ncbi:PAS domain-containing protein [Alkalinema sp. FACHB-956]|uniref:PAS domain-containing sensor histidine kinase n=1 Tax=Alkalinema sp. FACHB-956 TaxID=2692768 RepID=UPI00168467C7|nr:PAS domain-containing protein [Alkalinema sp. FACHB-956]MBD2329354.1 PAS domain-containing protein [Alkalinema sp. FACHB-956]
MVDPDVKLGSNIVQTSLEASLQKSLQDSWLEVSRHQLQFLQSLWEGVSYGIYVLDVLEEGQDFRFKAFNPFIARTCLVPVDQLLGKTLTEAFPLETAARYRQHYQSCVQSQQSQVFEECLTRDGQETWWMLTVSPLLNHDRVEQLLVTLVDITERAQLEAERKAAEVALAESEAKFRRLVENAHDIIGIWTLDGTLTYLAPGVQALLGYRPEDWVGKSFVPMVHPEDLPQCLEANQKVIHTGESISGLEFRNTHQDGRWIWLSVNIAPVKDAQGQVIALQGVLRDINDRKQQETALRFIVEGTLAKTGDEFLRACVQHLAEIVQVKYAFITESVDDSYQTTRMLTLWNGENFIEPYEFELAGTPCNCVFQENWGIFPHSLQSRFPEASSLAILNAESYLGTVIVDSQGKKIGNIGILDIRPLTDNLETAKFILQIFATRVGAELERKIAERKLQEQENFLRTVYEGAVQPIFVVDVLPDGDFRYSGWNTAAEIAAGRSSQEIAGKTPEEVYGEEIGALERQRLREYLKSGTSGSYEECVSLDGEYSWWVTTHNPVRDSHGNIHRFIGTTFDITEIKLAEAALQDYADRQTLFNQLTNQVRNSLDLDTVIATTIQSIREVLGIDHCAFAWYEVHQGIPYWIMVQEAKLDGVSSGLGMYAASLVGPVESILDQQTILCIDDASQYEEPIHRAFLQSIRAQSEILLPLRTNSQRTGVIICVNHASVRPWAESEVELLLAVRDQLAIAIDQADLYAESRAKSQELQQTLQELQRTQTQMLQSEKMSSLGQLVAGIAHEINNPVNFIHGNVSYAEDYIQDLLELIQLYQDYYPQPTPAISEKIEEIDIDFLCQDLPKVIGSMKVGTERIREIVKSLRLFSRLDEAEYKAVNIHDGIDSTLMILQNRLKAKTNRGEIQVIKDYGDLPEVECFAGQLNQVFMNILVNAIDALEERDTGRSLEEQEQFPSTIRIKTERVNPNYVNISFLDNGLGIPESIQKRLFDPFFTTKPIGKGTGMGMSISYQIVTEKHSGKLLCNSMPHKGTEFIIQIPIQQADAKSNSSH